jgi:hypothetical protein
MAEYSTAILNLEIVVASSGFESPSFQGPKYILRQGLTWKETWKINGRIMDKHPVCSCRNFWGVSSKTGSYGTHAQSYEGISLDSAEIP